MLKLPALPKGMVLMLPPFDIFRREASGEVLWVKAADDWKSARAAVEQLMASSPRDYIIHSHRTNNDLIVKPAQPSKRTAKPVVFQIAYDRILMETRAELLKTHGFEVVSALGNEEAKAALAIPRKYALFIVGHAANPSIRSEMAAGLKSKYPAVPILALNPPYQQELTPADYNIILNGPEEWLFIVEAMAA
jgi:hypothetical protein